MDEEAFPEWIQRVRRGEPAAVAEFVAQYGPQVRRAIRVRGTGGRLQRILDSEDLSQTVMRRFLEHLDGANLQAKNPVMLMNWLLEVARNRLREQHRRERTAKRGGGLLREFDLAALNRLACNEPDVGATSADRELLAWLMERMTPEVRIIVERRAAGEEWAEIACEYNTSAEALRKRYRRELDLIVKKLACES